jgi:hypothetical protein
MFVKIITTEITEARRVSQCLEKSVQKVPIFENFWSKSFKGSEGRPPQLPKMIGLKMRHFLATDHE